GVHRVLEHIRRAALRVAPPLEDAARSGAGRGRGDRSEQERHEHQAMLPWARPRASSFTATGTGSRCGQRRSTGPRKRAKLRAVLAAYLFSLVVGGALLVASLVGGHHDTGHDGGAEHDATHDLAWSMLSVRFWTYGLTFGGATGVLLRLLAHAPEP